MEWKNEKRKLSDLKPAVYNPRKITDKQKEDLADSLDKFDIVDPLVINTDGVIIGGHQRYALLKAKGVQDVDVRVPERKLNSEEEKELNLRLNKNTGEFDYNLLKNFDISFLEGVGFNNEELMMHFGMQDTNEQLFDPDRLTVITVEMPEAARLKTRGSFHCDSVEQYNSIKDFFKTDRDGMLDLNKLLNIIGVK